MRKGSWLNKEMKNGCQLNKEFVDSNGSKLNKVSGVSNEQGVSIEQVSLSAENRDEQGVSFEQGVMGLKSRKGPS